jgi:hypothetical protein
MSKFIMTAIAVILWVLRFTPSVSTFIDEDSIISGYGELDYDFKYPLPRWWIERKYGTTSWGIYLSHLPNKESKS